MNTQVIRRIESVLLILSLLFWVVFYFAKEMFQQDYQYAIDPLVDGYTPFASAHLLSLIFYLFASFRCSYEISTKGRKLPPVLVVIYLTFMLVGAIVCVFMMIQLADHSDRMDNVDPAAGLFMLLAPWFHLLMILVILIKFVNQKQDNASMRQYSSRFLNFLNNKLRATRGLSIWTVLIALSILLVFTLMLCLFGQEPDSLAKAFTETTTWAFSEKVHPEFLNH